MILMDLKRTLEKRRCSLINMLEHGRKDLELGKQHQIYGAIKEIEKMVEEIDEHFKTHIESTPINLKNDKAKPFFEQIMLKMKKNGK